MDLKIVQILYLVSIRFHVVENYHSSKSDFRGFMNSKNKHSAGVASLNASDGITYYDPTAKNIQNSKFSPLFRSNERKNNIKPMGPQLLLKYSSSVFQKQEFLSYTTKSAKSQKWVACLQLQNLYQF